MSIIGGFYPEIPYDSQCGFKLFWNSPEVNQVFNYEFKTKWFFDLEIHKRMNDKGFVSECTREEPLENWREIGASHLTFATYPALLFEIYWITKILRTRSNLTLDRSKPILGEPD